MASNFFIKLYQNGARRYCKGFKSQVARDLFEIGTKYGEEEKGISYGLSSRFINAIEEIPMSSKNKIVVPWMAENEFEYDSTSYDKMPFDANVVDYRISQEEFDAVINDLKRSEYWVPQYTFPFIICIGMMFAPLVLIVILMTMIVSGGPKNHPLINAVIMILCPVLCIISLLSPVLIYRGNISRLDNREEEFEKILSTWNHRVFTDRKVKWKSGSYGCWLEIHFDRDLPALDNYNREILEDVKRELQEEYVEEAKKLGVNIDGQIVKLGAVGCESSNRGTRGGASKNAEERTVGHAIAVPTSNKYEDGDDLEIIEIRLSAAG